MVRFALAWLQVVREVCEDPRRSDDDGTACERSNTLRITILVDLIRGVAPTLK